MSDITVTHRDGRVAQLDNVFIRGSKIRFLILPDMLKNAPMFKNIGKQPKGLGGIINVGGPRGRGGAFRRGMRGPGRGRGFGGRGGPPGPPRGY
mgnify:CR=1 FL=1